MAVDLNSMSAKELEALINQAKKRRSILSKRKPVATVRSRLEQIARAEGYSIAELFGPRNAGSGGATTSTTPARTGNRKPSKMAGSKVAPKYRNPENASETWAGRGKQPRWLQAHTDKGRALDEFLIR
ncbi:H-NS family nucleoid-associated regulatory protein [Cognatilysobacter lacus]|uniref:H-NS histone family protein n=1 Tax=Cognatilysobacter lacus TaxID=1643323 RepID=A0A5D8ZEZ5_9GAMM|nr:H-NS histone family protein [Lysobacter lacus]TZF91264.1 H-NS histone family protein [Lysobacter lacus]